MKKTRSLTKEILFYLSELGELLPEPFETPGMMASRLKSYNRKQITNSLARLRRDKWIRKERKKYVLTDLGKVKTRKYFYKNNFKKKRADDLSTIIIFDIPEQKRRARDFLRRFLLQNGFILLQKSVFIGPWEVQVEFKNLLQELEIVDRVSVIEGRIVNARVFAHHNR